MKSKRIGRKMVKSIILLALVICMSACTIVGVSYWRSIYRVFTEKAYAYTEALAKVIDGDRISGYLEGGEKDSYYGEVQAYMDSLCDGDNVQFLYVIYPARDNIVYVWDAQNEEEKSDLGDTAEYLKGEYERLSAISEKNNPRKLNVTSEGGFGLIGTANSPVTDSNGNTVALACVDIPMPGIILDMVWFELAVLLSTVVITAVAMYFYFRYVDRNIVKPLNLINDGAKNMVSNIESTASEPLSIKTGDEFEEVALSFNAMETGLKAYVSELEIATQERTRLGTELSVATQIQASYLPSIFPAFPDRSEFDIYATMDPAKEVGGDFYDFFLIDDDHMGLVMADVSGKGVGAALFMMVSKTFINSQAHSTDDPAEILYQVNERLCENNTADMFVTVWIGILEISTGKLTAANGGHEYPLIRRAGGKFEVFEDKHGFVIGGISGVPYEAYEIRLNKGDTLFLYTDGVPEATSKNEELFGIDRTLAALNEEPDADVNSLLPKVRQHIDDFISGAEQFDDITMMAVKYWGKE